MNLNDLFRELALGELSNLSVSERDTILAERRPQIVVYANEALLALHTTFVLKEKDMLIEMRDGVTNYHLLKRYAMSQYDENNPPNRWDMPYIIDTKFDPFEEDVIKILNVYSSYGDKVPLNNPEDPYSVFSPQSQLLQVPRPMPGQTLSIEYQARHRPLDHCNCDEEIELLDPLWRALKSYIAAKVCMHMNTQEMTAKGQEHMMHYELICQEMVDKGLINTDQTYTNNNFRLRGWV